MKDDKKRRMKRKQKKNTITFRKGVDVKETKKCFLEECE